MRIDDYADSDLSDALANLPTAAPSLTGAVGRPKCRHHEYNFRSLRREEHVGLPEPHDCYDLHCGGMTAIRCRVCRSPYDEARSRRGKQSRNYGNRAELSAARKYGGEKIGAAGGPVDIRGADFNTQVKTHRRLPPLEWRKAFAKMAAKGERQPRLLLRFVQGPGLPPVDYFVFQADDFLAWFGKDEGND